MSVCQSPSRNESASSASGITWEYCFSTTRTEAHPLGWNRGILHTVLRKMALNQS